MAESDLAGQGASDVQCSPFFHIERASITEEFLDGICEGPGSPGRLMRLAGPLGSGRTTLLEDLARIAEDEGWQALVLSGAEPLEDAVEGLSALSEGSNDGCSSGQPCLRHLIEHVTANLDSEGRGLVLLVDDVQEAKTDDLALLAECVQYEIRKGHDIALVLAGTHESLLACANGAGMGFLSRAKAEDIRIIPEDESVPALRAALDRAGATLEDGVLDLVLAESEGHAALLQCICCSLVEAGGSSASISLECARRCVREARCRLSQKLLAGIASSDASLLSILAMSKRPMSLADVALKLQTDREETVHRADALKLRGLLENTAPGVVALTHPFLGRYLREHADGQVQAQ